MAPDCSGNTTGLAFEATQEFLITYCLTFVCFILFVVLFKVHFANISQKLLRPQFFTSIFVQTFRIGTLLSDCTGQPVNADIFRRPCQKHKNITTVKDQHQPLSVLPPKDEYLEEARPRQTLVIEDNSSLLAPSSLNEPE